MVEPTQPGDPVAPRAAAFAGIVLDAGRGIADDDQRQSRATGPPGSARGFFRGSIRPTNSTNG